MLENLKYQIWRSKNRENKGYIKKKGLNPQVKRERVRIVEKKEQREMWITDGIKNSKEVRTKNKKTKNFNTTKIEIKPEKMCALTVEMENKDECKVKNNL